MFLSWGARAPLNPEGTKNMARRTKREAPSGLHVFKNESGAFDLPSILVGVVVVGILTAGVLAAIFGVIPFAQDKGAQQDLDALRTAEGVSKTKDGRFNTSEILADRGYLSGPGNAAAAVDESGSCYVAAAHSGSGKTYLASSQKPQPIHLKDIPEGTCVPVEQIEQLVEKVGGTWPGEGDVGDPAGATFSPIVAGPTVSVAIANFMNADMARHASPAILEAYVAWAEGDDASDEAYAEMNALEDNYNATRTVIVADFREALAKDELLYRTDEGIPALEQAYAEAWVVFEDDPTAATHQALLDAAHAWYQGAVDAPLQVLELVAGATYAAIEVTVPEFAAAVDFANTALAYDSSQQSLYLVAAMRPGTESDLKSEMLDADKASEIRKSWDAVKDMDSLYGEIKNSFRSDAGIDVLLQTVKDKREAYATFADGPVTVEQLAVYQQDYIDALQAFYTVTTSTPCPAGGCPTGSVGS